MNVISRGMVVKCGNSDEVSRLIKAYSDAGVTTSVLRFTAKDQLG